MSGQLRTQSSPATTTYLFTTAATNRYKKRNSLHNSTNGIEKGIRRILLQQNSLPNPTHHSRSLPVQLFHNSIPLSPPT
jgi:hypothetical protein